ncbi:hypothetical protein [Pleomorphomonas carboxyditropha]|uniref:Phage tail assembly protein n=1 Tax=Pleomorphomonas carboxyditropha TaxID=2023338 RepID=A0A2G9WV23_9HYPH|nr:hypothetical protein [Pleomorphomonas carboxyditropha]PIO98571.1 hypothetical protein CJ014_14735 [Pleomorphomonas carboxyditropha]
MTDDVSDLPPLDTGAEPEKFPLPPADVVDEMLKQDAASTPARPVAEPAKLNFVSGKVWAKTVPLDFEFELEGRVVSEITVHRLTTAEMGDVVDRLGTSFTRWDLVAAMVGLPVEVLRGLEAGDGDAVMEVAIDFLPKGLKG